MHDKLRRGTARHIQPLRDDCRHMGRSNTPQHVLVLSKRAQYHAGIEGVHQLDQAMIMEGVVPLQRAHPRRPFLLQSQYLRSHERYRIKRRRFHSPAPAPAPAFDVSGKALRVVAFDHVGHELDMQRC